jgi:DNA methylase
MKWSNKPRIAEATQFFGEMIPGIGKDEKGWFVVTIHGQRTPIEYGDFIVQESTDPTKHYPCKPDIWLAGNQLIREGDIGQVICMDALQYLDVCEPVKCIIMDPPDNIRIPYDGYDDRKAPRDYVAWIELLILKAMMKCQVLWLSYHPDNALDVMSIVRGILRDRSPSWTYAGFIWAFNFGQYNDKDFCHGYRPILRLSFFNCRFYPDAVRIVSERQMIGDKRANEFGRVPSNVWEVPRVVGNSAERRAWHPTQHPEAIMERIIQFSVSHFETTLDLFSGSGTVRRVCSRLGKPVISVEQSPLYCERILNE